MLEHWDCFSSPHLRWSEAAFPTQWSTLASSSSPPLATASNRLTFSSWRKSTTKSSFYHIPKVTVLLYDHFFKVNLIPVIAKADSFTTQELKKFKSKVKMCIFTRMPNSSLLLSRFLTESMLKNMCFSRLSSFFTGCPGFWCSWSGGNSHLWLSSIWTSGGGGWYNWYIVGGYSCL